MKNKKTILSMKFIIILFLAFFPSIAQSNTDVTLSIGDTTASLGSSDNSIKVSLANPYDKALAIETLLVDEDNNLTCTGCTPDPVRAPGFMCSAYEQGNGGCKVVMVDIDASGLIEIGNGAVGSKTAGCFGSGRLDTSCHEGHAWHGRRASPDRGDGQ